LRAALPLTLTFLLLVVSPLASAAPPAPAAVTSNCLLVSIDPSSPMNIVDPDGCWREFIHEIIGW